MKMSYEDVCEQVMFSDIYQVCEHVLVRTGMTTYHYGNYGGHVLLAVDSTTVTIVFPSLSDALLYMNGYDCPAGED